MRVSPTREAKQAKRIYCVYCVALYRKIWSIHNPFFVYKDFIYLFSERGEEKEKEGEKHQCARETSISCLSYTPNQGPNQQSRHVPWLGMEQTTFRFAGLHPTRWATPVRAIPNLNGPQLPSLLSYSQTICHTPAEWPFKNSEYVSSFLVPFSNPPASLKIKPKLLYTVNKRSYVIWLLHRSLISSPVTTSLLPHLHLWLCTSAPLASQMGSLFLPALPILHLHLVPFYLSAQGAVSPSESPTLTTFLKWPPSHCPLSQHLVCALPENSVQATIILLESLFLVSLSH